MYKIKADGVFIHESVERCDACGKRLERMMQNIESAQPARVVSDEELNEISRKRGWMSQWGKRTGELDLGKTRSIIFNTFRWHPAGELNRLRERFPHLKYGYLLGDGAWGFRNGRATRRTQFGICQNAYELHSAWGCLHTCDYCNIGEFINIAMNVEDYLERLPELLRENPWLKLYKYDNHTDILAFEPEYGWCERLVEFFSRQDDAYLMIYTKSDNVDFLLPLKHDGKTIVCWTISCDTVSRLVEKDSPPMHRRIEAARKCQEAGYRVRARFSPIIPVKNWREENERMLEEYLSAVKPDIITMDMLKWIEPREARDIFDLSLWDEEFVSWVDKFAEMEPTQRPRPILPNGKQLFPHEVRAGVYRFFIERIKRLSPRTKISLCGETPEMWEELRSELGMTPERYVCACGPDSVPGNPILEAN